MAMTKGREFIHTTMHDFKSNIAKYTRILNRGDYKGVIVKRYNEPLGLYLPMDAPKEKPKPKDPAADFIDSFERIYGSTETS